MNPNKTSETMTVEIHKVITPKIINVGEIHRGVRGSILLHFTAEQWKHAKQDLKKVHKISEGLPTLEVVPMPGAWGAMLAGSLCPPDCRPDYQCFGDIPETFTCILMGCICPPPISICHLAIRFGRGDVRAPSLVCVDDNGKSCPDYEPQYTRSGGVYLLTCGKR